ncbi:NAD-dependent epimerase/dehydratase family protein [Halorubrum sp. CBA1229]|uniref:NAD-dependent epimerase/dehydratase family protein n=1 Tax=Halorubrum sp. CBA1229 TaxID=1853699 RepID=UPI000F3C7776|nr:NAD-dependent epimerase/dehydratase family protein [Halorubrum sp. CBA1229]QKY15582.1 GDP-mannose 4,6-dehydratase [Halorubrum sp. CBA1229]
MTATPTDRNVLVTGGAGFIGSHLVDALVGANDVTVLDDFSTGYRENVNPKATVIEGDIRDRDTVESAMDGIDLVFHEAALVSVDKSVEQPQLSHETNATPTLSILDAARENDARVILASSAAIYGRPSSVPVTESEPKRPNSPYGIDKLYLDHHARTYHDLYGLETVALRYFNVYGPRQRGGPYSGVISIFADRLANDEPVTVHGDGTQTRDFVHVSDVVQANLLAAETDAVGEAFNVGTGSSISIRELADLMRESTESTSEIVHTEGRSGDIERSVADIRKAKDKLGYDPTIDLEDGIRDVV